MKDKLDCLLVGYKEFTLEERRLMAGGNVAALNYCKHEYVKYNDKIWFYDDFISLLSKEIGGEKYKISELPYLGIMYLENYLRNRNVSVCAYNSFDFERKSIDVELETKEFSVIAISAVFYTNPISVIRLVRYFRDKAPNSKIVVGGAFISNEYETLSKDKLETEFKMIAADYFICDSQGEQALYKIVSNEKNGLSSYEVNNVIEYKDKQIKYHTFIKEYNDINCDIIDYSKLSPQLLFSTVNLRTARGCPNRCGFCNYPVRNPKLELQTYENIEKQLRTLYSLDVVKNIVFIDDSFNMPLIRFKEICRIMIRLGKKKPWYSYFRMSHCDEEAVKLMKQSNCQGVFLGIESADNTVLDNMNKRATVEQYITALDLLKKYDISTYAYFLIGYPGETNESIEKNIELLNSKKIDFYSFNLWYAETNTPVFEKRNKFLLEGEGFKWKHYTMDSQEASSKMDYIYQKVTESIYIPGENFSFWGVPYLLGKGFDLASVKKILINIREYIIAGNCDEAQFKAINNIKIILESVQKNKEDV